MCLTSISITVIIESAVILGLGGEMGLSLEREERRASV